MNNIKQLLNKENWLEYLKLADEVELTNNAKANDIVSKIETAINFTGCSMELPNKKEITFEDYLIIKKQNTYKEVFINGKEVFIMNLICRNAIRCI